MSVTAKAPDALRLAAIATGRERLLIAEVRGYAVDVGSLPDKLDAITAAVAVFSEIGTAYALIGGLAVGIRSGIPRATLDVDFAIPTTVHRQRLTESLARRGFRPVGEFPHSINFHHSSGEPVQLAFDPAFDAIIERAESMDFGDLRLAVVTTEDLIAMKRRAAADPSRRRSKALRDQADIALLEGDVPEPNEGW
jgi:hypothetical protein